MRSATKGQPASVLVLLSLAAGATDAFAFVGLGGIFTANMTGNLILIGLFGRDHFLQTLIGATDAVAIFLLALFAGFRLSRPAGDRSYAVQVLGAACAFQFLACIVWLVWAASAPSGGQYILIAVSSAAMALQTVAAKRAGDDRSISTTFVTGTMTALMQDIADGVPGERGVRVMIVLALPLGAVAGAAVLWLCRPLAGLLPAVILLACIGQMIYLRTRHHSAE